ncbi:MAG: SDR family oxidoreductase [Aquabacterium sp.]
MVGHRRSIFITGAAAGIGRAVAERFAREGWVVGLYDVDEAGIEQLRQSLVEQFGSDRAVCGRLDVADAAQWSQAMASFVRHTGRLDVLLNNAGVALTAPFADTPLARHHWLIDINVKGVVNGCHVALPYLKQTPGARAINLCSASALYGQPLLSTYSASKAAVRSLTEALDIEWARHGVRVMDVLPLFVNTAMVRDEVAKLKTVQTLGVRLTADDVARQVWRLAEPASPRCLPVHSPVGWQTHLFYLASKLTPDWLNGLITAKMAGQ